jgi:hypothetical protein
VKVSVKIDGRIGREMRILHGVRWRGQVERILREYVEKEAETRKSQAVIMALDNLSGQKDQSE